MRPWATVALALLAVVVIALGLRFVAVAPPHRLVIAADEPDGYFTRTAMAYGTHFAPQGVALDIVSTHGALDNLERISAPSSTVDVAFLHGGLTDAARSPRLLSLGSVAYDPVWVVYRAALGDLDAIPALRGRKVGIGREGSGTEAIARRILTASGVTAGDTTLLANDAGADAATLIGQLTSGALDAAFLMDPPEEPRVRALFGADAVRVMNMTDAEGLARNLPFLHALHVPKSTVDLVHEKPDRELSVVASTITLVTRKDVHPALLYLLMSVVDAVHEPPSLLHRENEFPSDKDTDLPLAPEAEAYYKNGKPILQRYLPFALASAVERLLKVAVPVLLVLLPFLRGLPAFNLWRVKRKLARSYRQLLELERQVQAGGTDGETYEARLRAIEDRVAGEGIPVMYSNELYILREHIDLARRHIGERLSKTG